MKQFLLSFIFLAAFGFMASAQKNEHGKMVSTTAHKTTTTHATTTTTSTDQNANGTVNHGTVTSTTKKHYGWKKGKHMGTMHKKTTTTTTTKM
jgi:hypothetical protein